jgi:hypothetical protein
LGQINSQGVELKKEAAYWFETGFFLLCLPFLLQVSPLGKLFRDFQLGYFLPHFIKTVRGFLDDELRIPLFQ